MLSGGLYAYSSCSKGEGQKLIHDLAVERIARRSIVGEGRRVMVTPDAS